MWTPPNQRVLVGVLGDTEADMDDPEEEGKMCGAFDVLTGVLSSVYKDFPIQVEEAKNYVTKVWWDSTKTSIHDAI